MVAVALATLMACIPLTLANPFEQASVARLFGGEGTYYGDRTRGFGHCSFHFHGFGNSPGYQGTPLAINAAQYHGSKVCGLCVRFRGVGQGSGGNPVASSWQAGFICDSCPECKWGDLDQQKGGDGRWKIEWYPVQCPVGSSNLRYGFQGGNPWYRKLMVANARAPVRAAAVLVGGSWQELKPTVDNYFEYHGEVARAWTPCAKLRVTSILGDTVTDNVCCSDGTCWGNAQLPCHPKYPGDGCSGGNGAPQQVNVGGIAPADGRRHSNGGQQQQQAAKARAGGGAAAAYGRGDLSAARVAASSRVLSEGAQCGGKGFKCGGFGPGQCRDAIFSGFKCGSGLRCVRNDANWWGCRR